MDFWSSILQITCWKRWYFSLNLSNKNQVWLTHEMTVHQLNSCQLFDNPAFHQTSLKLPRFGQKRKTSTLRISAWRYFNAVSTWFDMGYGHKMNNNPKPAYLKPCRLWVQCKLPQGFSGIKREPPFWEILALEETDLTNMLILLHGTPPRFWQGMENWKNKQTTNYICVLFALPCFICSAGCERWWYKIREGWRQTALEWHSEK